MRENITARITDEIDLDAHRTVMDPYDIFHPILVDFSFIYPLPPGNVRYEAEIEYVNPIEDLYEWQIAEAGRAMQFLLLKQIKAAKGNTQMLYLTKTPYLTVTSAKRCPATLDFAIRVTATVYTFPVGNYITTKGAVNETE